MEEKLTKVILFGVDCGEYDMYKSMDELDALAQANGMVTVAEITQKRDKPEGATCIGEGKLYEGKLTAANLEAECAIFDCELTGSQLRNLENALEIPVIDRTMLILEIFANRAITNEGKLQTELARLQYSLPRLAGMSQGLSRQGGGGGGGGGARRGAGESKLEYDRRYIRSRIAMLKEKLAEIEKHRAETRRSREKSGDPVIALVGYTNVGKSSLLNALCGAEVQEADMLFATLDPTARKLTLPSGLNSIAVDTVGFVSRLPHSLVDAFKSTLEEAAYADVIVRVCDASDEDSSRQLEITDGVLTELGCDDIPKLTVYNKCDKTNVTPFMPDVICTSAKTGVGLDTLLSALDKALSERVRRIKVLLPYDKLSLAAPMRTRGTVITEEYRDDGVYYEGIVKTADVHVYDGYFV